MKLTTTLCLLAASLLLFYSCKKEDNPGPCNNCILVAPDTLQTQDTTSATPPTVTVTGQQASISVTSDGNYPDSEFEISIGDSGEILAIESLGFTGTVLYKNWSFDNLIPGTYPVRIKQIKYVPGTLYPSFNFTVSTPTGTAGTAVPVAQINKETNEIDYSFILQVNL